MLEHLPVGSRARTAAILAAIAAIGFGFALAVPEPSPAQDFPTRPNDTLTPGKVASTDVAEVCGIVDGLTYSKRHRKTPAALKREVYAAYHVERAGRDFEVDHRVPLCIGGADVRENLWPQEGWQHPSFHDKDMLEVYACHAVCYTHKLTLPAAQALFLGDWVAGFEKVFGRQP